MTLIVLQGILHLGMYKSPGGRELWEDRWKGMTAGFNGQDLSLYFWESFHQFVPRGFHLSLGFRCMLTQRAKDTGNTRFVACISCPTNTSVILHSDLVRERLGRIPSVRNLRPRESGQLFFMDEKPTEEFQFASILVLLPR